LSTTKVELLSELEILERKPWLEYPEVWLGLAGMMVVKPLSNRETGIIILVLKTI